MKFCVRQAASESRILRFTSAQAATTYGAAEAVLGQPDLDSTGPNNGGLSAATLNLPFTCAIDDAGHLFVTDSGNSRVLRYDNAATKATGASADGVLGQTDFTSIRFTGTTASAFGDLYLHGIALGANGSLYVSDARNRRVLRFDNAANKANGAAADGVLGAADFVTLSVDGTVNATTMSLAVLGLTLDAAGNLYVADSNNHRIMRFNDAANKANGAAADGVLGADSLTAGPGTNPQAYLSDAIFGIDVLPDGSLYVADAWANRVLIFNNPANKADGANADSVLGQPDFETLDPALTASGLDIPLGLGFDSTNGNLMIADSGHNRVVGYYSATLIANDLPTALTVAINGTAQVGVEISGSYTYQDTENNPEGASTFRWVRNSVNTGVTGGIVVATTQNYTAVTADVANFLYFCVTPVASAGNTNPGTEVCSVATAQIPALVNGSCVVSSVAVVAAPTGVAACTSGSVTNAASTDGQFTWGCAGSGGGSSTTGSACSVPRGYNVTPYAKANGSITPNTVRVIAYNTTTSFTVSANPGHTAHITGTCGGNLSGTTYTTHAITAACNVAVTFPPTSSQTNIQTRQSGVTATLSAVGCTAIGSAVFLDAPAGGKPAGKAFPYGLIDFTLTGCVGSADVTVTYSQPIPAGATYYKEANGTYSPMTASIGSYTVSFTLQDDGPGDAAGTIPGTIRDPSGLAFGLAAGVTSVPTLSEWGLLILSALMAIFGIRQARRRGQRAV